MDTAVLLLNLIASALVLGAIYHVRHVARLAPKQRLRLAWWTMALVLSVTLVLVLYVTIVGYLWATMGPRDVADALVNFFGSIFIFAVALLSRLTMDDVLKNAELEVAAFTDKLTSLPNRRRFDALLPEQIDIAKRRNEALSLAILDIDHFKAVNDTYGHPFGDKVLRDLARLLSTQKRTGDIGFRVGGEEFALLITRASLDQSVAVAERLRLAIENTPVRHGRTTVNITVSIGVAELRPDDSLATLAQRADAALYEAKRTGRNRVLGEAADEPSAAAASERHA